ncbi:MAG: hypothetical protein MUF27_15925 [Acidobacteria bacterium]|jgi:hypothetical protein|nr:hypothetical protein [Acidobacteriota bacterium]
MPTRSARNLSRTRPGAGLLAGLFVAVLLAGASVRPARAYTPGSGTLYTANFESELDADWEQGNGLGQPSPWTRIPDGGDSSFYADGKGPYASSPSKHWARHHVVPATATTFSIALEYRTELGAAYYFDLDLEQRAPTPRKYRLRVDSAGRLSLWRTESGTFVQKAATGTAVIPVNQKRWIRFAIQPGSGHPVVRARVWSGSAGSEPASWTLEFTDENDTLARVHRFELTTDGPVGNETWIDDLDAFGDASEGVASTVKTIYIAEWSHLDIGFTEPPDEIEAFAKTHLDQVLANLAADPAYRFFIEESWFLARWWERSTESERDSMVAWLRSGRLSLGAGYASLHTTTAGHEELTRNLYWASRFAREHQVPLRTWITDDVPGSTFALPELLARSGIEYYLSGMNTPFGGRVQHPHHGERPWWWVGPDGSRVLTWHTFDAYAEAFDWGFSFFDGIADIRNKTGKKLPELEELGYPYPELMLMRAFDNHYQGFKVRDLVNQWNATYQTPKFVMATPEEFLDLMLAKYGADAFPSFSGDFGAAWSGSHADAPHTERMVRQAHREARAAEALLAAGSLVDGLPVPQADVDHAYRRMLEVDEHSGAGGWPGYFTPEEMDRNNRAHLSYAVEASSTTASLLAEGLQRATAQVPAAGDAVIVSNPLGRARDGWARVALPAALYGTAFRVVDRATGQELPYQRFDATSEIAFRALGLPAIGYRVYDLQPGAPAAVPEGMLQVTPTTLENDHYRLVVDPADGSLTTLTEKATGRALIDPGSSYRFNRLASSTKSDVQAGRAPTAAAVGGASVTVRAAGPLIAELQVTRTGTPHTSTVYRLRRGENRVEFDNTINRNATPYVNNATSYRWYTVTLPFNLQNLSIYSETTTRFLRYPQDGFPRDNYFDWHNVEHTLGLFDEDGGVLYAVDNTDAHHLEKFKQLTPPSPSLATGLLLSRMYDRSDEYEFEGGTIGPYTMEPDTAPILRFTHSVRGVPPLFDPVAASRFGFEALNAPLARYTAARPGSLPGGEASFFSVDAPNVLLYTVKRADDGDGVILRMTELAGVPTTARISSGVFALSAPLLAEQDEEGGTPLAMDGGSVVVELTPYMTATIRVRAALPVAAVALAVTRNDAAGAVHLEWTGGAAPFRLVRAEDPQFTLGVTTLLDGATQRSYDDPVLGDGKNYFYRVE